jgi:glycine/D-amino acid oxidase-like deaminating enzyme
MDAWKLSSDFSEVPYWWEAWRPHDTLMSEVPDTTDVAIVGAGYAGLSCALELAKSGLHVTVLEAAYPGSGASTLSGGQVSGGINVGKSMSGKRGAASSTADKQRMLAEAADSYTVFERILSDNGIDCDYRKAGRINAFWLESHVDAWRTRVDELNRYSQAGVRLLSKEQLRAELATGIYAGGALIERAGQLHPSRMLGGMLDAARRAGAVVCSMARVTGLSRRAGGFRVTTARGAMTCREVMICTNGYTDDLLPELRRAIVPVVSHQIATEPLPADLRTSLIPLGRGVAETRRVVNYYRYSPDGTRLLFGGRARFYALTRRESAKVLRAQMVRRFPQLDGVRVSHSWGGSVAVTLDYLPHIGRTRDGVHYALGCNGSGVVMMTYLGYKLARLLIEHLPAEVSSYGTPMVTHPLYGGTPWFMPVLGSYYQVRDVWDKRREQSR